VLAHVIRRGIRFKKLDADGKSLAKELQPKGPTHSARAFLEQGADQGEKTILLSWCIAGKKGRGAKGGREKRRRNAAGFIKLAANDASKAYNEGPMAKVFLGFNRSNAHWDETSGCGTEG